MTGTLPLPERILQAAITSLGGIVSDGGVTYWYTPDRVIRSDFDDLAEDFSSFSPHTLVIVPDTAQEYALTTAGGYRGQLDVYVLCAKKDGENLSSRPGRQTTEPQTVKEKMIEDVKKKLLADRNTSWSFLPGESVPGITFPAADLAVPIRGWFVAHLLVSFDYKGRR